MRWTVIVPMRALATAKSRLVGVSADPAAHARLVEAMRADTVAAALAAHAVARVVVVAGVPDQIALPGVVVVGEPPGAGLNGALRHAAALAQASWPADGVAALAGDLPALTPAALSAALGVAARHARAVVTDAQGTGTTLLTCLPGHDLAPEFGVGSAQRHTASGAFAVTADARLRTDVDLPEDLAAAVALGVGPATAAALPERLRAR